MSKEKVSKQERRAAKAKLAHEQHQERIAAQQAREQQSRETPASDEDLERLRQRYS